MPDTRVALPWTYVQVRFWYADGTDNLVDPGRMPRLRLPARRRFMALLPLLACTLVSAGMAEQATAARSPHYSLSVSKQADRSPARSLAGRNYSKRAKIYIFLRQAKSVKRVKVRAKRVRFYIDDPTRSRPLRMDRHAPFDFAGTRVPLRVSTLSAGSHTIIAAIRMTNGKIRVTWASFTVSAGPTSPAPPPPPNPLRPPAPPPPPARPDTSAPSVSWKTPAAGASIAGLLWALTNSGDSGPCGASASDNVGVTKVVFHVDGTLLGATTAAPYNCKLDTRTLPDGSHTLKAVAHDAAGNTTTVLRTVNVNNSTAAIVNVDRSQRVATSKLELGVTMSQYSLDSWGNAAAVARGQTLLDGAVTYQNQFIYGWGVGNPEPSPGVYDWSDLDARMRVMRGRANAIPVFTLCGAPDWMTPQGTNTSAFNLQSAPTAAHYDDFAELARQTALRYSSPSSANPVIYYQVWSELRGFWSAPLNNADYVGYTTLYNKIYDALKSVNPAIKVGGPYPVLEGDGAAQDVGVALNRNTANPISERQKAFLSYWLVHKRGAQFLALDRSGTDFNDTNVYTNAQKFKLMHWFGDVVRQVRELPGYAGEPIWWSEGMTFGDDDQRVQRASEAASLRSMLLAGTSVMLKWQDQGTYGLRKPITGFYTDTRHASGGQPYPSYTAYKLFHDDFPVGTPLFSATSSSPRVQAVASPTKTLLINESNTPVTVTVGAVVVTLSAYEVRDVPA